jgi:uncharacterized membrane protein (Fun14 family)
MGETMEGEHAGHAAPEHDPSASDIRKKTWPHGMPALRLSRVPRRRPAVEEEEPVPTAAGGPGLHARPGLLRAARLLIGLALLVLAWAAIVGATLVAQHAWQPVTGKRTTGRVLATVLVSVLETGGACWLGLCALACIFAGAFSLYLGLTRRRR